MATQTNIVDDLRKYFTTVNDSGSVVKCKICDESTSRQRAPAHMYRSHKMTDQKLILRWNSDNDSLFQYFSKKDLYSAECKFCGELINSAYNKRNLDKHLQSVHSKSFHQLEEHFVHGIEKQIDYLETTMQSTTEENNVATSSQDGNTH